MVLQVPEDFLINISEEFYNEILEKKIWLDSMIFMNMEGKTFKTSFRTMADTTNAIVYNARKIGVASKNKQEDNIQLSIEYFNFFTTRSQ